ncbi:MAG: VIT1/CCC1 transporter family protein [Candidatus Tritonobacter lacicola]|nr:VIT1/CCC1 transporter family protein [Candidatus Tritonobacter lacicola]
MAHAESIIITIVFLFILGFFKTRITKVHWLKSVMETLMIGVMSILVGPVRFIRCGLSCDAV